MRTIRISELAPRGDLPDGGLSDNSKTSSAISEARRVGGGGVHMVLGQGGDFQYMVAIPLLSLRLPLSARLRTRGFSLALLRPLCGHPGDSHLRNANPDEVD